MIFHEIDEVSLIINSDTSFLGGRGKKEFDGLPMDID